MGLKSGLIRVFQQVVVSAVLTSVLAVVVLHLNDPLIDRESPRAIT